MNILIVSSNYFPEPLGIGLYSHELSSLLTEQGHRVWVLTTFPYYPWWKAQKDLESFAVKYSNIGGVHVHRANIQLTGSSTTLGRILFEGRLWSGLKRESVHLESLDFDQVISFIPSLGAGLVARGISIRKNVPLFLIIQDITTSGVSESGMSFGSILRHIVLPIERQIIRSASSISIISESMLDAVRKISSTKSPIVHLPNYDTGDDEPNQRFTRKDFELPADKFVVIHAGSIARKQDLESLVCVARSLKSTEVQFYLYGHGNAQEEILRASQGLDNFFIRPSVPKDRFKSLLKCADLLLVNERSTQVSMALPSKLVSYFASEVAVLAIVPKDGPTYRTVKNLAFWAETGDAEGVAEKIKTIIHSPIERQEYARKARIYYEKELSRESGRKRYMNWLFGANKK